MIAWLEGGGPWMLAILAVGLLLYALIIERLFALWGSRADLHDHRRSLTMIRALVAAAPLFGLLGTVSGMIDSFDALVGAGRLHEIGGGIGAALRTTQYGLSVAIPGVILERLIARRSEHLEVHA